MKDSLGIFSWNIFRIESADDESKTFSFQGKIDNFVKSFLVEKIDSDIKRLSGENSQNENLMKRKFVIMTKSRNSFKDTTNLFLPLKEWINTLDQKFREAIQWSSYENFLQNVQWELKKEKRDFPETKGMNIIQFANHHILFRLRWVVTNLKSSSPRQNYRITMYFDISFIYSNIFWREFPWIRIKISLNWQHILQKQSLKHWWMKPPFWIRVFQNLYEEYSGIFSHFLTKVSWSTREHTERSSRRSSRVSCIRVKIHELILREEKFITEFIQGIHSESQKRHFWRIEWKKILTWKSSWINSFSSLCAIRGP